MNLSNMAGRVRERLRAFALGDDALAITEYGILVALVALAMIAVLAIFGAQISSWFGNRTATITTV